MFLKTLNNYFFKGVNIKKIILISILIFILSTLSFVSANNVTDDSLSQLTDLIDSEGEVNLTKNYIADETPINLNKSVSVNGENHTIDGNDKKGIIQVNNNVSLVFKNTTFKNISPSIFNITSNHTLNITLIDCKIITNNTPTLTEINLTLPEDNNISYSGHISDNIKKLAKKIVGKSKDIAAAKKLAKWVRKHIVHETRPGFYQSPDTTLLRRMGNCCCHSDLFLQMCVAIGLDKTHKLGFVHVGTEKFNHRHYFTIFDNIIVDTDCGCSNPWGHASIGERPVHCTTLYPILPLARNY